MTRHSLGQVQDWPLQLTADLFQLRIAAVRVSVPKIGAARNTSCALPKSMSQLAWHVMRLHSAVDLSHFRLSGLLERLQPAPLPYLQFSSQQTAGSCMISVPGLGSVLHVTIRPMVLLFSTHYYVQRQSYAPGDDASRLRAGLTSVGLFN